MSGLQPGDFLSGRIDGMVQISDLLRDRAATPNVFLSEEFRFIRKVSA